MAGAFVAVADDATAVYWNPGGLAFGPVIDIVVERQQGDMVPDGRVRPLDSSTRGIGGHSYTLAVGTPPLGLSYYRLRATSAPVSPAGEGPADRQNIRLGEVAVNTLLTQHFGATFVQSLTPALALGTTVKIVRGTAAARLIAANRAEDLFDAAADLEGRTTTKLDLDAGLLAVLGVWRIGVVGRNLRKPEFAVPSDAGASADPLRLNRQIRAGVAFAPRSRPAGTNGPMTIAADIDVERIDTVLGHRREMAVGGEGWWFQGRVGARAGVRFNTLKRDGQERDPVVAAGLSLSPKLGSLLEGQITRGRHKLEQGWGVSFRVTF